MSTRAVVVPAEAIIGFLTERGFKRRAHRGAELVYERAHEHDPRYRVLVYTSVRAGAREARGTGKDAIRVCAIYDDGRTTRGLGKWPRVHRTGSVDAVLARMLERMRLAYARCSEARARTFRIGCAPPIDARELAPETRATLERICDDMDRVQEKHHPGSMPRGHERALGERFPEDDLDEI